MGMRINKLEPDLIILENENIMCLLAIKMGVTRNTLIIPKKIKNIFDVDELYLHKVTKLLLQKILGTDGVNFYVLILDFPLRERSKYKIYSMFFFFL